MDEPSLYERLGEREGIRTVVDEFYERVLSDEELRPFFEDVNMREQRGHQARFLVTATGGPELYDGGDMSEVHDHLDVGHADFSRIAVHLADALLAFDVAENDIETVMAEIESFREPIVTDQSLEATTPDNRPPNP